MSKQKRLTARPKGKKYFTISISLTQEQIDYLRRKPNASEVVRKILTDLIAAERVSEDKTSVISLNLQLEEFNKKLLDLKNERNRFLWDKGNCWKDIKNPDGSGIFGPENIQDDAIIEPEDTEDAKVAFRVFQGYEKAIEFMKQQITEIKQKILQTE